MTSRSRSFSVRWIVWLLGAFVLIVGLWLRMPTSDLAYTVLGSDYLSWQQQVPIPTVVSSDPAGGTLSLGSREAPWRNVFIETKGGEPGLVLDYGELILATPTFVLDSRSGGNLNLRYTERIDGAEYPPLTQETGFSLTAGNQTIEDAPRLFRYLEIRFQNHPEATTLTDVVLKDIRQGSRVGYFHSSDEELNTIWRMSARSVELSTATTYIDSPHRDNATWLGDAREIAWADEFLTGDRKVADATLATFAKRVRPDGAIIAVDHLSPDNHEDWVFLDYLSRFVTMVAEHYDHFGDDTVLAQYQDLVDGQLNYLKQRTNDDGFLVVTGDLAPANDWSSTQRSGVVAYHQTVYWRGLMDGARIARAIGDEDRAATLEAQAQVVQEQTLKQLTDPETGLLLDFLPQAGVEAPHIALDANILAIGNGWYDAAGAQERLRLLQTKLATPYGWQALDRPYVAIEGRFDISPMMNARVVEALFAEGMDEEALALTKQVWGHLLKTGATTSWEFINPKDGSIAGSISHGWSGIISRVLSEQLLGLEIDPLLPRSYILSPKVALLDDLAIAVPTPQGVMAYSSKKEGDSYRVQFVLPKGTTAEFHAPDGWTTSSQDATNLKGGRLHTISFTPID